MKNGGKKRKQSLLVEVVDESDDGEPTPAKSAFRSGEKGHLRPLTLHDKLEDNMKFDL